MGKRGRRRAKAEGRPVATTRYTDPEGNVLTLRDELSAATLERIRTEGQRPGASLEDRDRRHEELLFERLAIGWEIAGLPIEGQKDLLARYRMSSGDERAWVNATVAGHVRERFSSLGE